MEYIMSKVLTIKEGNLIGNLYKSTIKGNEGYYYKIYLGKQTKGQLLAQSYVYLYDQDQCVEKMKLEMKTLMNIDKDLFDFTLIDKM